MPQAIFGRLVQEKASENTDHVSNDVQTRDTVEPIAPLFDPGSIASVRYGPAEGVQTDDLGRVQIDKFARCTPPPEGQTMNYQV